MSPRLRWSLVVAALCCASAGAEGKKLAVGVYLPATIDGREKQFEFAQALAAQLTEQLGQPVAALPFARHEDFSKAAADGTLDFAISEAVVLAQARGEFGAVAAGRLAGDATGRWAIVTPRQLTVSQMAKQRLAVVKGPGNTEAEFISNVVFAGDLPRNHFSLVFVPSVDSALKAIEAGKADAALIPLIHAPSKLKVIYRTGRISGALLVNLRGNQAALKAAAGKLGAIAPFSGFAQASGDEVAQLRRRIARPPGARTPLVAESPPYRPHPAALGPFNAATLKYPSFVEFIELSKELPDD